MSWADYYRGEYERLTRFGRRKAERIVWQTRIALIVIVASFVLGTYFAMEYHITNHNEFLPLSGLLFTTGLITICVRMARMNVLRESRRGTTYAYETPTQVNQLKSIVDMVNQGWETATIPTTRISKECVNAHLVSKGHYEALVKLLDLIRNIRHLQEQLKLIDPELTPTIYLQTSQELKLSQELYGLTRGSGIEFRDIGSGDWRSDLAYPEYPTCTTLSYAPLEVFTS